MAQEEMLNLVQNFLKKYDGKLQEYLQGQYWNDCWEAPESVDELTRSFINDLKIPRISDNPVLLLHDLGKDIVDTTLIDNIFTYRSK